MKKNYEILIGADILPTYSNQQLFTNGNMDELLGTDMCQMLKNVDFRIFNIEGPLTDIDSPIVKDGPVLKAPENTAYGLRKMGTDLAVLANNHILDHGKIGVERTIAILEEMEIRWIGVGKTRNDRNKPYIISAGGNNIGVINCCEHEYSVQESEGEWSANAYDPLDTFDEVVDLKGHCDYVIVLYHGGKEKIRYPSPKLRRIFRKFAEKGADVVIAQHTHCIGCYELYDQALLIYGQGNFIFDRADNEFYDNGLLVKLSFSEKKGFDFELVPVEKKKNVVRLVKEEKKSAILSELEDRSKKLLNDDFLEAEYTKNSLMHIDNYLMAFHGRSILSKVLMRLNKGLYIKMLNMFYYSSDNLIFMYNFLRCEAHHELFEVGLKNRLEGRNSE